MRTSFTEKEKALIPIYLDKYIKKQTIQQPYEKIKEIVDILWGMQDLAPPEVILADSPAACNKACPNPDDFSTYWSLWHHSYAAMYEFGAAIGLDLPKDTLANFLQWCDCCPFILFNDTTVYVSRKPVELHFNDAGQLNNEEGMAYRFADNWGNWVINGVVVDEQIVMNPDTQTVKQITDEQNEEVKRIRIERFGWVKYLEQTDAKLIDFRDNAIEGTEEQLYSFNNGSGSEGRVLLCLCPSTGKEFALEWGPEVNTCEEVQAAISNGLSNRIISAS